MEKIGVPVVSSVIDADVVVDALFGIGLSRDITGTYEQLISEINKMKNIIYAVDIPSGINGDTR